MARFVVQEHHAKRLHWDFRLEIDSVLKSWAVPKGPSLDPKAKRLAVQVPDHDLAHVEYEGIIAEGSYGAGPVVIWDSGAFEACEPVNAAQGLQRGNLQFNLKGKRLRGEFALVKMHGPGREQAWLLIKKHDHDAVPGWKTPVVLTPSRHKQLKAKALACALQES
jgi:bifunctional non-homologous end joining protein LigD